MRRLAMSCAIVMLSLLLAAAPGSASPLLADSDSDPEVPTSVGVVEPPVPLSPGESHTTFKGGVPTTYIQLAAGCTTTVTANNPRKVNGMARGSVRFTMSTGCSSSVTVSAQLNRLACGFFGCHWRSEDVGTNMSLTPGGVINFSLATVCGNSTSDQWRTTGHVGLSGEQVSYGNAVTLSCGM